MPINPAFFKPIKKEGKIMKIFNTLKALLSNKADEINQKLIEDNPEAILEQAIKEKKIQLSSNEEKLAEMHSFFIDHQKQTNVLKNNLVKIQQNISVAQRQGDMDAVKEGTALYKQREFELSERITSEIEIQNSINEITELLKKQRSEIEKLETEKLSLLAKLKSANMKEQIMNLSSSITFDNDDSFANARESINKKINKVKGKEIVTGSTETSSKYFKGL